MAKRIKLDIPGVRLNETEHRTLALVAERARATSGLACEPTPIPLRDFVARLEMSQASAMRSCHSLHEDGLMVISPNRLETGAQVANSYSLTALGIEVLRLADAAVAEGRVGVS